MEVKDIILQNCQYFLYPLVIAYACATGSGEPKIQISRQSSNFKNLNSYQQFKLINGSVSHRKNIYRLRTIRKPPILSDEFGQSSFGRANRRST